MFSRYFAATLWILCAVSAPAQRLGQTKEQVVAESGLASEENHSKSTAVYRHKWLRIEVTYDNGIARRLVCTSLDPLSDDQIREILKLNAAGGSWHELNVSGAVRLWQGANFAQAKCDRLNPRVLTLYGGVSFPSAPPVVTTPPVAALVVKSTGAPIAPQRVPAAAGKAAADNAISPMVKGLVTALFGVVFPLVVIGLAVVFVVKGLVPWLIRRHANAPAKIIQRQMDPGAKKVINPCPSHLYATAPRAIAARPTETLDTITWDNFELLIAEIFRRKGYSIEISSGLGADGGKDLTLRKDRELAFVQCKKLAPSNRVTATQMRDFFGLMVAESAAKGFFVTTGYFSADAKKFAVGKPIELLERSDIEALVAERSVPGENLYDITSWVETFASRVHIVNPTCPFCESPMKLRRGAFGRPFWGCTRYRTRFCKGKRDPREGLLQARAS